MATTKSSSNLQPASLLRMALWFFLIVFAARFVLKDAFPYFGLSEEVFGRYWEVKWTLIGHISSGIVALLIGPFQFSKAFRTKYVKVHRLLGKTYLTAIVIGTICSTYLAWTSGLAVHWTWALSLQMLALAWICTATMAFIAIKRKHVLQHKEWMMRSYVVTFAFVTFRWINELQVVQELGKFVERGPTEIWVSWVVPLFIAEMILQGRKIFR